MRWIRLAVLVAGTLFAALLVSPAQAVAAVSFDPAINIAVGDGPASIAVGDFNGDGNPDLAVANQLSNNLSVLLGSASGGFTRQAPDLAVGGFPVSVAVGDFNSDSDPDLAVANGFGTVSVMLGGDGARFTRKPDLNIGGTPWSVAVGDFNGDSHPDLAVANQLENNVSILLGSGDGSFTRQTPDLTVGAGPTSVAVGDFNGDSDPDLAVANQFDGTVSVLLGTSGGAGFSGPTPAGNYTSGLDLMSVAVGDFNGDGHPDLAVGDMSPGEILVFLGKAGGSFSGPTTFTVDSGVSSVAVGDFNRDGDPDLAVANFNFGRLSVLVGGDGGSFGGRADFPAGSGSPSVAVGDFNRDGKPDFAVASVNADTVAVRLNTPNKAPTAADDAYTTTEDTALTVNAPGVLGNDSDPDHDPLSAALVSRPSHGTLTMNANGSFTYRPEDDFNGSDSFTYRANDGTVDSNQATVTITITATNDEPTAAVDTYDTAEGTALRVNAPGVLANDNDPDGNPLSAVLVSEPNHGTLTLDADGSFTYSPAADYDGTDFFTYQASDGTLKSNPAKVTITIAATNKAPIAADDAYRTPEDTTLTVNAPGVLSNDSDPDHDPLSAALVLKPSHGTLTLDADGSFTYTPVADYEGTDFFTYQTSDGTLTSDSAKVTLTVSASNDSPTVRVAAGGTCGKDDHSGTVNLTVADVESSAANLTLSAASSSPALVPTGNVNLADSGAFRTMSVSTVDGRSGTATLTITVSDGQDSGSVSVTVQVGGGGKDTLTGSDGADLLLAQSNNDALTGGDGNDLLCGDSGNDTLSGGAGDDSLGGGSGSDKLTGGSGADRFSGGSGTDVATDFTAADTTDGTIP